MFQAKYFYMYSLNQLKNSMCQHYYYPLFLCLWQCKQKQISPYRHKPGGGGVKI